MLTSGRSAELATAHACFGGRRKSLRSGKPSYHTFCHSQIEFASLELKNEAGCINGAPQRRAALARCKLHGSTERPRPRLHARFCGHALCFALDDRVFSFASRCSLWHSEMRTSHEAEDAEPLIEGSSTILTALNTSLHKKSRTIKLQWAAITFLLLTLFLVVLLPRSSGQNCSKLYFAACRWKDTSISFDC